nr:hypothetical protein [Angustibacter aerolatus]
MKGEPSFLPSEWQTKEWEGGPYGRTLHFGIREHAMGAIMNGIALQSLTRPYGGTFLTFSDYMRGAVRLAALMRLGVTYVWTHDSIGLGEDGPTHQPVEHLAALRAIPGLDVVRPGDANETAWAWKTILEHHDRPAGLILSRQALPTLDRGEFAAASGVAKGGYVLAEADGGTPQVILVATGSEPVAGRHGPRAGAGRRRADPRGLDAVPRVVLRAAAEPTATRCSPDRASPGERRGGHRPGLARRGRRRRPHRVDRALRRQRRRRDAVPRVRVHPRAGGRRGPRQHRGRRGRRRPPRR